MRRTLIFVLLFAYLVVIVWVALANASQSVQVSLLFGTPLEGSLAQVIVTTALVTLAFGGLVAGIEIGARSLEAGSLRRRSRKLEARVAELEKELDEHFAELAAEAAEKARGESPPEGTD